MPSLHQDCVKPIRPKISLHQTNLQAFIRSMSSLYQTYVKLASRLSNLSSMHQIYVKTASRLCQTYAKSASRLSQDSVKTTSSLSQACRKHMSSLHQRYVKDMLTLWNWKSYVKPASAYWKPMSNLHQPIMVMSRLNHNLNTDTLHYECFRTSLPCLSYMFLLAAWATNQIYHLWSILYNLFTIHLDSPVLITIQKKNHNNRLFCLPVLDTES